MTRALNQNILSDHRQIADELNFEETLLALSCAQKVMAHLKKHPEKYAVNIALLSEIIEGHRTSLDNMKARKNKLHVID